MRAARLFDFFAGESLRNVGERFASTRPGATVEVDYAPVGVVAAITPWNFPIAIPAWQLAPALAFGNTAVLKPSEFTPAIGVELMKILERSGAREGIGTMVKELGRASSRARGVQYV